MKIVKLPNKIWEYQKAYANSIVFDPSILDEDVPRTKPEIIASIKANDFDKNKSTFKMSLDTAVKRPHGVVLSSYGIDEINKMDTFKVKGIAAGYALKKKKGGLDIVSVHNASGIKQLGELLLKSAIANGGNYLDCFDGFLVSFYKKLGFIEYHRDSYDPQYDPEGKLKKALGGERDVVYMKLS